MGNVLCHPCASLHSWLFTPVKVFAVNHRRLKSLRVLGEGGFARVFLVQDMKTKRLFALKVLLCDGPGDLEDVLWEVGVHRTISHPGVQKLVDYSISQHPSGQQQVLMLLPYFPRGTLADELRAARSAAGPMGNGRVPARGPYDEERVLDIVERTAQALRELHLHEPTWAHRDVKCDNILLSDRGDPVLTDFGSVAMCPVAVASTEQARRLQDAIDTRTSPLYRAPELFDVQPGQIVDEKCDVWALGCVMWAVAFGEGPFEAEVERGGAPSLCVLSAPAVPEGHGYSEPFVSLLRGMMAIGPDDRPNIDQVIEGIEEVRAIALRREKGSGGSSFASTHLAGTANNAGMATTGSSSSSSSSASTTPAVAEAGGANDNGAAAVVEDHGDLHAAFEREEEDAAAADNGAPKESMLSPALISDDQDQEMTSLFG